MKKTDARGRLLNYERGQIHQQIDVEGSNSVCRKSHRFLTWWDQLDRLVDAYDAAGKPDVPVTCTGEQAKELGKPLAYRGHPIVIAPVDPPAARRT